MFRRIKKTSLRTGLLAVVLLLAIIAGLALLFRNPPNEGNGVIPSTKPQMKTPAQNSGKILPTTGSQSDQAGRGGGSANASSTAGGPAPTAPSGSFVSNHHPSSSTSWFEESLCTTTPGASCYLKLTKGSIVKTLASQTVDSSGATSWSWNVQTAGLTSGDWKVTAVATLNGQTKTTDDPLALVIP